MDRAVQKSDVTDNVVPVCQDGAECSENRPKAVDIVGLFLNLLPVQMLTTASTIMRRAATSVGRGIFTALWPEAAMVYIHHVI